MSKYVKHSQNSITASWGHILTRCEVSCYWLCIFRINKALGSMSMPSLGPWCLKHPFFYSITPENRIHTTTKIFQPIPNHILMHPQFKFKLHQLNA